MLRTRVDAKAFQLDMEAHLEDLAQRVVDEVEAAANEVRNEALMRTPVDTGALRAAWKVRGQRTTKGGRFEVSNETPYAAAVEYGTKPRQIRVKNAKVLADRNGNVFGRVVNHPGSRPRHMLRGALASVLPRLRSRLKGLR